MGNGAPTLEEIAREFGTRREKARQLEKESINQLRHTKEELSAQGESMV
jgi:DNA-directed RNA polymerase sigma subunit (sigma70/sigma32)